AAWQRLTPAGTAGCSRATDLGERLVRCGVPFREADEIVGHLVVWCQVHGVDRGQVSEADLADVSPHLTPDVREVLSAAGAIAARSSRGGTAGERVAGQLAALRAQVDEDAAWGAGQR